MKKTIHVKIFLLALGLLLLTACDQDVAPQAAADTQTPVSTEAAQEKQESPTAESAEAEPLAALPDGAIRSYAVEFQYLLSWPCKSFCYVGDTLYAISTQDGMQYFCIISLADGSITEMDAPLAETNYLSDCGGQLWLLTAADGVWTFSRLESGNWETVRTETVTTDAPTGFQMDADGILYVTAKETLYALDAETGLVGELSYENAPLNPPIRTADGQVLVQTASGTKTDTWESFLALEIDLEKMTLSPLDALSEKGQPRNSNPLVSGSGTIDLFMKDGSYLYTVDVGDGTIEELLCLDDYTEAGSLNWFEVTDGKILSVFVNRDTQEQFLCLLAPTDVQRQVVVLGTTRSVTRYLNDAILAFNAQSDTYLIRTEYYDDDGLTYNSLNVRMLSGESPDLLFTGADMYAAYYQKGYLTDLYTALSQQTLDALDKTLLRAMSINDALYMLYPKVSLVTQLGLSDVFGESTAWTPHDAAALKEANPNYVLFSGMEGLQALERLLTVNLQYFVDYENGSCTFDSDEFKELLWLSVFQNYISSDIDERDIRSNLTGVVSFDSIDSYEKFLLQYEAYQVIGFPAIEGSGTYLSGIFPIGVCNLGRNQAGAIAFVEYLLSETYQMETEALSLRTDVLKQQFEDAAKERELTEEYYSDEESVLAAVGGTDTSAITDTTVLRAMTEEEIVQYRELLHSVTCTVSPMQSELTAIIEEEFQYYLKGDKDLDEVAEIIQSRAEIFVAERQ